MRMSWMQLRGALATGLAALAFLCVLSLLSVWSPEAAANPCSAQCRQAHNQCRIQTKGSPSCDSQLAQCLRSCIAERPGASRVGALPPPGGGQGRPPGGPPGAQGPGIREPVAIERAPEPPKRGLWRFWRRGDEGPRQIEGPRGDAPRGDGPRGPGRF